MHPEWFEERVHMATLIAPAIEMAHSTETFLLDGAKMTIIPDLMIRYNYLEFNGAKTNGEEDIFELLETVCTFQDNKFCDGINAKVEAQKNGNYRNDMQVGDGETPFTCVDFDRMSESAKNQVLKRNVKFNSGTSTKNFMHGIQVMNSGRFQRFDFGADGNIESYG